MRKLMALAIVLVVTGVGRSSAFIGLGDLKYDGSLEFAGFSAKNEVDQDDKAATDDRRGDVNTRQRLGINGEVTDNVRFRLELGRMGQFGKSVGGSKSDPSDLNEEQSNIHLYNVFLDITNIYAGVDARIGRQYVGNAGDLAWNISPSDDNNLSFNSIDGVLLQHRASFVHTDLFLGKHRENDDRNDTNLDDATASMGPGDINLNSLDFVFPTIVPGAKINAGYLWGVHESTQSTSDDNKLKTYRLGINGGLMDNRFTYRAEWFMNDGQNSPSGSSKTDYEGSAIDVGAGFNIPEGPGGAWGFNVNAIMASGDDNTGDNKDESFRDFSALGFNTSDRYLGDIFGKSGTLSVAGAGVDSGSQGQGLEMFNLGFMFAPVRCPRSTFRFDWYTFNTAEDGSLSSGPNEDKFGDEMDFNYWFKYSENVNLNLGYAMFSPDSAVVGTTPGVADDDITQWSAKLTVKWGDMGGGMTQIDPPTAP